MFADFDLMVCQKISNMITLQFFVFFYLTIINNHVNSLDYLVHNSLYLYFAHVESYILNQDRLDKGNKYWNGRNTI